MANEKLSITEPTEISTPQPRHPIQVVLDVFLRSMDDFRDAVRIALPAIIKERKKAIDEINRDLDLTMELLNGQSKKNPCAQEVKRLIDHMDEAERISHSQLIQLTARGVYIGIFSVYDSFIGSLLKAIYFKRQDLLKDISKNISLKDLMAFATLDEIKREMLEQEIDSFRRNSYIEQFSDMENKFGISTLKQFKEWPDFVEMSQRRNVMAHNDGRVSQQYLSICDREKVHFESRPSLGEELPLNIEYLSKSILTLSKVGFMLAHTLWRKLLTNELEKANDAANDAIFNILKAKRWRAAVSIGEFCLTMPMMKGIKEVSKMIRVVNMAIAYKSNGEKENAISVLDSVDWSACIRDFKLANAILKDDYTEASKIMISIGKSGEFVSELHYLHWPLFEEARGNAEFQQAFEIIYGRPIREVARHEAMEQPPKVNRLMHPQVVKPKVVKPKVVKPKVVKPKVVKPKVVKS